MTVESALRILLVDDNPDHALLTKNAIVSSKHRKYEVHVSGSIEEAMEEIEVELDEVIRLAKDDANFRRGVLLSKESLDTIVDASIQEHRQNYFAAAIHFAKGYFAKFFR